MDRVTPLDRMALLVALLRERTGPISDSTVDRLARELEEILHELQASARKAETQSVT